MNAPYQNTTDALEIAVKALQLALSNAKIEGALPNVQSAIRSQSVRIAAFRQEIIDTSKGQAGARGAA